MLNRVIKTDFFPNPRRWQIAAARAVADLGRSYRRPSVRPMSFDSTGAYSRLNSSCLTAENDGSAGVEICSHTHA